MKMKVVGVKVPPETYDQLKAVSQSEGISVSEFARTVIVERLTGSRPGPAEGLRELTEVNRNLTALLERKESQAEQLQTDLSEASKRSDTIIMQLSKTIEQQQSHIQDQTLRIEDLRQSKPLLHRLFRRQPRRVQNAAT